jgi:hypothetical protein
VMGNVFVVETADADEFKVGVALEKEGALV